MAAQFHRGTLHVHGGEGVEVLADRHGPRERDLADDRRGDQIFGDFGGYAIHEIDDAGGHAGVMEAFDEGDGRGRRLLRALDDNGTPSGQRATDLAGGLRDGEIPRAEAGDGTDRLHQHHVADAIGTGWDNAAVSAAAFLGEPFDDVGRAEHFDLGFGQDFSLLERQQGGDLDGARAHQFGNFLQDLTALEGGNLAPHGEALGGSRQGMVEVGLGGMAKLAERGVGRRVHDILGFARRRLHPFSVDVVVE